MNKIQISGVLVATLAMTWEPGLVMAQTTRWTNFTNVGNSWAIGSNWTNGVPTTGVDALLPTATGAYIVNYDVPTNAFAGVRITDLTTGVGLTLNINTNGFQTTALGGSAGQTAGLRTGSRDGAILNINTGGGVVVNGFWWSGLTGANATPAPQLNLQGGVFSNLMSGGTENRIESGGSLTIHSGLYYQNTNTLALGAQLTLSRTASFNLYGGAAVLDGNSGLFAGSKNNSTITVTNGSLSVGALGIVLGNAGTADATNITALLSFSGGTITNKGVFTVGARDFVGAGSVTGRFTQTGGTFIQHGAVNIGGGVGQTGGVGVATVNAGTFIATNSVTVGAGLSSTGALTIAGGSFLVTNSASSAALTVGRVSRGSLTLNGGTLTVDRLFVTNGANSTVTFNGGTLNTKSTTVNNGSLFTAGNGSSAATLNLVGGSHSFANGLSISSNATLMGTGAVIDNTVTIQNGGNFNPGASPGTLTVNHLTLTNASQLNFELGPHDANGIGYVGLGSNDLGVVTGDLVLDGALNVTALDGFSAFGSGAASTNVYRIFNYSGTLTDNGLTIGQFPSYATGFIDVSTPGQVNLLVIPEPTMVMLLTIGLAVLRICAAGKKRALYLAKE